MSSHYGPIVQLKRVVVTGVGLVTPLGVGRQRNWAGLKRAACGVRLLQQPAYDALPCRLAAPVPEGSNDGEFDWASHFSPGDRRQMSRGIAFAVAAAKEAWLDSGRPLPADGATHSSYGVCFGQGMVDLDDVHNTGQLLDSGKYKRISPYFVPRILTNMAAVCGFHGPNHAVSTACTTGAHAIGDAFNLIRLGMAEAILCGGADACISPISLAGFARCRALSTGFHDQPDAASRPFDKRRDGFVMGEGAGCVLLESLEHYRQRQAQSPIYAELLGYGLSGDAHHVTAPDTSGRGARLCMQRALDDARLPSHQVAYVNAHATSTPLGDGIEASAIGYVCQANRVHVSSTKGHTGHLLGAAGAVESIFTCLSLQSNWIPPTLNLHDVDIPADNKSDTDRLNFVTEGENWFPEKGQRRVALSNSFGFGGTNASLCFGEFVE